jgi:hypothetical protein
MSLYSSAMHFWLIVLLIGQFCVNGVYGQNQKPRLVLPIGHTESISQPMLLKPLRKILKTGEEMETNRICKTKNKAIWK